ncbi:DUF5615 family PIN-like protein [Oscillatoria acuminata]|uniref:DUF5615 domain-containing protein n=1 Tax=Oscillatoria acuminata PCC 6304 TaxID=56110 RepID=K9TIU6_9CYAN|nr:DUF5615 family PIN-like protein [Oscillatoria acuminata]AFY82757.1 hypothetical protein Oscil6304_3176 [Oscillatoria acuminata PCC 6304]
MKIRFQADVDLNHIIVKATLRRESLIDFQSAQTANLDSLSDLEVLAVAARLGRVLVSHDRKTMPLNFSEFITQTRSSGVIIIPQNISIRAAVEDIVLIWEASEAEEWINRIHILPL